MTRKDYVKFAAMLKDANSHQACELNYREGWHGACSSLVQRTADIFAADNPNFDRERFLQACGVES